MTEPTKVLRRLPQQGQLAGVCAGLAQYMSMDVTLIRAIFIILAVVTGGGFILVYILLAVVMPSADAQASTEGADIHRNIQSLADDVRTRAQQNRLRNFIGLGLILLGVWLFLGQIFPGWIDQSWSYIWPIVLILAGIYIATRRNER